MPLLTEALRAVQPRELFDARIFAGLLFAIIAGEKNLIVDVEVEVDVAVNKDIESDSTLERYGGAGHRQFHERKPLADQIAFRSVDFDFVRAKDVLETKVRRTVEHVSRPPMSRFHLSVQLIPSRNVLCHMLAETEYIQDGVLCIRSHLLR